MKILLLFMLILYIPAVAANELANSPSPYLAMHGNDPVNWRDIDQDTLKTANKAQKLIFISSGYFSCHWCHVMQRESYQDTKIAEYLNQHFIPIKIDREMNPVLDAQLIAFVERTRGVAGWPLNVFLTPDGHPLFGLTYLPPEEFYGVLTRLTALWKDDPESLMAIASAASGEIQTDANWSNEVIRTVNLDDLNQSFLSMLRLTASELEGGFGNGSKFPMTNQLSALLALNEDLDFLRLSLDAMSREHLMDHVNGGFFRYTTDPDWQTPHFEKMLYDNALLASLFLKAGSKLNKPRYQKIGIDTLHFVIQGMRYPDGGYIASLSALDHQGTEGGHYLWSEEELSALLDKDGLALLNDHWEMNLASLFETGYLPTSLETLSGKPRDELSSVYDTLRQSRNKDASRGLPVDDKRLSGWNGLVLSALTICAQTGDKICETEARQQASFLLGLIDEQGLNHGLDRNGKSLGPGTLEDYAYVLQGLWAWGSSSRQPSVLKKAQALLEETRRRFYRPNGWLSSQSPLLPGMLPQHHMPDGILPSPTALLLKTDQDLSRALNQPPLLNAGRHPVNITRTVNDEPFSHASLITFLNENPRPE